MNSAMVVILSFMGLALAILGITSAIGGRGEFTPTLYVGIGLLILTVLLSQGVQLETTARRVLMVCRWAVIAPLLLVLRILMEGMTRVGGKAVGDASGPFLLLLAAAALLALPEIKWLIRNVRRRKDPGG